MKLKIKYSDIALPVLIFFISWNSLAVSIPDDYINNIGNQTDETVFEQKLKSALTYLESVCGKDGITKVVVLKDGKTIFKSNESDLTQNVWSCTKSFTSTVLGLLIEEGKCSLDDKVCKYVPELKENYPDVTFRHFATMTSGYKAEGHDAFAEHGQSNTPFQPSREPLFAAGTEFRYWDSAMNMFALALTKVAGKPIKVYFKEKVANPIGMNPEKWDWKDFGEIDGVIINGGAGNKNKGIYISATEMATFGQLFLNYGNWNGHQIVPVKWIEAATSPQVKNIVAHDDTPYGFNWWTSGTFPDAPKGTFAALGFNNNKCIVIPEWNVVVARLGLDGNIDNEKWNNFIKILSEEFK
jgi:CubicO group peptidase (beta-lactamase class C family)